ncbi:hypothetical protein [Sandarakinorhabdus sp. DWP1-3-1]|uniref:hypothetical protein n=1 Tax=Sandarakinorhabdus sp. DWP1-3-1 TaxID=2804627 RepID=UPI003CEC1720
MTWMAPPRLLSGVGIDDPGDPHLAKGGHIRLFANPALGLPVAPIIVSRTILDADRLKRLGRRVIEWRDSNGLLLTPPFDVVPGNPVYGTLPPMPQARCIWIRVDMTPQRQLPPIDPRLPLDPRRRLGDIVIDRPRRDPADVLRPLLQGGLQLAQMETSLLGPAVVQSRSTAPYMLAGSHIARIRVSGSGTVRGVTWVDANSLKGEDGKRWTMWSLPHDSAPRYLSLPDPRGRAKDRVANGAPKREAMYDAPGATPATAPAFADPVDHDVTRVVKRYDGDLEKAVDRLVGDLSAPPSELVDTVASRDEISGRVVGTINVNLLAAVQLASVDPGMARWLGFADTDPEVPGLPAQTLVLYWIDSWWDSRAVPSKGLFGKLINSDILGAKNDPEVFRRTFDGKVPDAVRALVNMGTIIPLIVGVPPDRPLRPAMGALLGGPWNTTLVPPAAARQVTVPLSGLTGANVLAFARSGAAGPEALHEKCPDGGRLPISAALLPDALTPGRGEVYDRFSPPDPIRYRVAQADWFGRWSEWNEAQSPPGIRPRPPRPVPELFYTQPDIPDPMHDAPLAGSINVRVAVPQPLQLPPGSQVVTTLEMTLNGGAPELVAVPGGALELDLTRVGPALARCATGAITLTCRWRDAAGMFSDPSPEMGRDIKDPRPPAAIVIPEVLAYGSRPDVTGKSRIQLRWTNSPGQATTRVYQSDETTLLTVLEKAGASTQGIRDAIAAAPNPAARAAIFVANKARFGRTAFELVNPDGFTAQAFEHKVSGSLRVLVFYRIVPVSAASVEGRIGDSALVPYGIPNSGPPATPLLIVKPVFDAGDATPVQAQVIIRVPQGPVQAGEYRLRRSAVESRIVERMPVARTGSVPPLAAGAGPEAMQEVATLRDTGGNEFRTPDVLLPWTAYSWVVEVRGGPEPGSSVPGEWSPPSAAVTTAIIPPGPPPAPENGQWDGATEVSFSHPEPLRGGSIGAYAIDLYAQPPGGDMAFVAVLSADAEAANGGRQPDRSGRFRFTLAAPPVSGTVFRAMITDPAGRTSVPSAAVIVP